MTEADIQSIQKALIKRGFDPGPVDGIWGKKTAAAAIAFKKSIGLRPVEGVGPLTRAALFDTHDDPAPDPENRANGPADEPLWLALARTYLGLAEYPGNRHNPKILEWWVKLGLSFRDDETPWCAAFVCGVLEEAGIRSTRSAAARSFHWEGWGRILDKPALGAVASLWRGAAKGASGHVGFIAGRDRLGHLMILGGNQGNRVSIRPFDPERVLSFHWPPGHRLPDETGFDFLPALESDGRVSMNEV